MARILIIDDNPSVLCTLGFFLGRAGHTVLTAFNGAEGLRRAESEELDLVLTDLQMPGMGGLVVCEALRADPRLARTPVVLMTAGRFAPDVEAAAAALGGVRLVRKPFDCERLLREVLPASARGSRHPKAG